MQAGVEDRDRINLMTDSEIIVFINEFRGGLKKDLKMHRTAIFFIWVFGCFKSLTKFDLPLLYAWVERLEKIKNLNIK